MREGCENFGRAAAAMKPAWIDRPPGEETLVALLGAAADALREH